MKIVKNMKTKKSGLMYGKTIAVVILMVVFQLSVFSLNAQVEWTTVEEMGSLDYKKNEKLGFIDFSTSWCGWCKKLDKETFANDTVARILNKYYHAAKFDAESKDDVKWKNDIYKNPDLTKRTIHSFTKHIIIGKITFPTTVVLDRQMNVINVLPGFYPAKDFVKVLWYFVDDNYKKLNFESFLADFDSKFRPEMNKKLGY